MASPDAIATAWATWHSRHGGKLGPGPAFSEAINAALAVDGKALERAGLLAGLREAAAYHDRKADEADAITKDPTALYSHSDAAQLEADVHRSSAAAIRALVAQDGEEAPK